MATRAFLFLLVLGASYVLAQPVFSYYQHTFHCAIDGSKLQIAGTVFSGSRLCLDLVSQLKERQKEINAQLDRLTTQGSTSYNNTAKITLRRQRSDINKINAQILSGVVSLEGKLYAEQKKKYYGPLRAIRTRLVAKQATLHADLVRSVIAGHSDLVLKISQIIGFNYQRLTIISGILSSKSLDEMLPLLDIYKQLIEEQVSGK